MNFQFISILISPVSNENRARFIHAFRMQITWYVKSLQSQFVTYWFVPFLSWFVPNFSIQHSMESTDKGFYHRNSATFWNYTRFVQQTVPTTHSFTLRRNNCIALTPITKSIRKTWIKFRVSNRVICTSNISTIKYGIIKSHYARCKFQRLFMNKMSRYINTGLAFMKQEIRGRLYSIHIRKYSNRKYKNSCRHEKDVFMKYINHTNNQQQP